MMYERQRQLSSFRRWADCSCYCQSKQPQKSAAGLGLEPRICLSKPLGFLPYPGVCSESPYSCVRWESHAWFLMGNIGIKVLATGLGWWGRRGHSSLMQAPNQLSPYHRTGSVLAFYHQKWCVSLSYELHGSGGSIILCISKMRMQKQREVQYLAPGHTASKSEMIRTQLVWFQNVLFTALPAG